MYNLKRVRYLKEILFYYLNCTETWCQYYIGDGITTTLPKCYASLCHKQNKWGTERTSKLSSAQRLNRNSSIEKKTPDFCMPGAVKNFNAPFLAGEGECCFLVWGRVSGFFGGRGLVHFIFFCCFSNTFS